MSANKKSEKKLDLSIRTVESKECSESARKAKIAVVTSI
jgi:hypothetical protein